MDIVIINDLLQRPDFLNIISRSHNTLHTKINIKDLTPALRGHFNPATGVRSALFTLRHIPSI